MLARHGSGCYDNAAALSSAFTNTPPIPKTPIGNLNIDLDYCRMRQKRVLEVMHQSSLDLVIVNRTEHVQWLDRPAVRLGLRTGRGTRGRWPLPAGGAELCAGNRRGRPGCYLRGPMVFLTACAMT